MCVCKHALVCVFDMCLNSCIFVAVGLPCQVPRAVQVYMDQFVYFIIYFLYKNTIVFIIFSVDKLIGVK